MLERLHAAGIKRINVIAHSMGNGISLEAIASLADRGSLLRVNELIMAAPDVDRNVDVSLIRKVTRTANGLTLYASKSDGAMKFARLLAGAPGAGDIFDAKPVLADGVDAIDVSAVGPELFGLNHNTFADQRSLVNDLAQIIRLRTRPPNNRLVEIRMMPEGAQTPLFWRYVD